MKDFGPEAVAEQVPETKSSRGARGRQVPQEPDVERPRVPEEDQDLVKDESARKQLLKEVGIEE